MIILMIATFTLLHELLLLLRLLLFEEFSLRLTRGGLELSAGHHTLRIARGQILHLLIRYAITRSYKRVTGAWVVLPLSSTTRGEDLLTTFSHQSLKH